MNPILMKLIEMLIGLLGAMFIAGITKLSEKKVRDRVALMALGHVKDLMSADMKDEEKRAQAFASIRHDCEVVGLEVRDWLINSAIEAAVGKVKADAVV